MAGRHGMALIGVVLCVLAGCSNTIDTSQYKPYDQLPSHEESATSKPNVEPAQDAAVAGADVVVTTPAGVEADEFVPPVSALAPVNFVDGLKVASVLNVASGDASPRATSTAGATTSAAALPGGIRVLIPERDFRPEGPRGALRVSYDDLDLLKVVNMDRVPDDATAHFPSWLQGLHGKRIRVRGFMFPTFESTGLDRFVLARDNQICCFGRDPKIYDLIAVEMGAQRTTDYIPNRPFDVVGTFRIDLLVEGGKPLGLYWIDDAQVIDR